jgi:hypothetical protein
MLVSHSEPERNGSIAAALQLRGIDIALRDDKLRFSPHVHNGYDDIDVLLDALAELA